MAFMYQCGDHPLEKYTIKRGIGSGGFGDVYLAVSDGGKEVALKCIRSSTNREIEKRGVSQCINLKHPSLLTLYDLCTDERGETWIVMELLLGQSLALLISKHPTGLPLEQVRSYVTQMGDAIHHLHDHGIVHRDLKPGNVFIENNIVKVGDYGLSKTIGSGVHRDNTQRVGTTNYMAPELITGSYDKKVDIYALGIILYEMLTGKKPFAGVNHDELLRKQLNTRIDFSQLPSRDFIPILSRALAIDKNERYPSIQVMMEEFKAVCDKIIKNKSSKSPLQDPVENGGGHRTAFGPIFKKLYKKWDDRIIIPLLKAAFFSFLAALFFSLFGLLPSPWEGLFLAGTTWLVTALVLSCSIFWKGKTRESITYRMLQSGLGVLVGAISYRMSGPGQLLEISISEQGASIEIPLWTRIFFFYMAAMFFPKWWKMTWRYRGTRVDYVATMIAFVWALLLAVILKLHLIHVMVYSFAVIIAQLVALKMRRRRQG